MTKKKKVSSTDKTITPISIDAFIYTPLENKTKSIGLLIFILLSILLYFQCFQYGYVLDDKLAISENNFTKSGFSGIWKLLSTDTFMGYLGEENNLLPGGRYRPLSLITFAIEHQFFGLNPKLSHFINVILYGFCGLLTWVTMRRLFQERAVSKAAFICFSFLVAILFITHPIHTEAVSNIKGRDEIMSYFFSILTLSLALKYFDSKKISLILLMVISYFLGLMSKENTITFLAIIPAALLLFRSENKKAILLIGSTLLVTSLAYLALRFSIIDFSTQESTDVMNNPFVGMTSMQRYATISYTLLKYIGLMFVPAPLTHDYYPYHIPILNFGDWRAILSIVLHLSLILMIPYFWKKHRKISFSIIFYLASISIVSNIIVGVGTFMNERFAFTASLSACIVLVYLIKKGSKKFSKNKNTFISIVGLVAVMYSILTISRVPAWESELALNSAAIKVSKNSARANSFMATALFNRYKEINDNAEKQSLIYRAEPYAQKAAEILPYYKNANLMLSGIAAEKYRFDKDLNQLLSSFKTVASRRPDIEYVTTYMKYLNGRADQTTLANFYVDVAQMLQQQQKYDWALHYLLTGYNDGITEPRMKTMIYNILISQGKTAQAQQYQ